MLIVFSHLSTPILSPLALQSRSIFQAAVISPSNAKSHPHIFKRRLCHQTSLIIQSIISLIMKKRKIWSWSRSFLRRSEICKVEKRRNVARFPWDSNCNFEGRSLNFKINLITTYAQSSFGNNFPTLWESFQDFHKISRSQSSHYWFRALTQDRCFSQCGPICTAWLQISVVMRFELRTMYERGLLIVCGHLFPEWKLMCARLSERYLWIKHRSGLWG